MKRKTERSNTKNFFSRMLSRSQKKRDLGAESYIPALMTEELISKACWESLLDIDFETFLEVNDNSVQASTES